MDLDKPTPPAGLPAPPPAPPPDPETRSFASWGSRVGAYLLDSLITLAGGILVGAVAAAVAAGAGAGGEIIAVVGGLSGFGVYILLSLFYSPALMARAGARNGQTWGKQVLGIRSVRDSGDTYDFGAAALRETAVKWLLFGFLGSSFLVPWALNYLWPLWDAENRALHDMLVGSHVLNA